MIKPTAMFDKNKSRKHGVGSTCKLCKKKYASERFHANPQREYEYKKRWYRTERGAIFRMLDNAKARAKKKNIDFDIDYDFVCQMLSAGVCELTGWPVSFEAENKAFNRPSIDRKDNSKGYTKDNVRLVCWGVNSMLNHYGEGKLITVADAIRRNKYEG